MSTQFRKVSDRVPESTAACLLIGTKKDGAVQYHRGGYDSSRNAWFIRCDNGDRVEIDPNCIVGWRSTYGNVVVPRTALASLREVASVIETHTQEAAEAQYINKQMALKHIAKKMEVFIGDVTDSFLMADALEEIMKSFGLSIHDVMFQNPESHKLILRDMATIMKEGLHKITLKEIEDREADGWKPQDIIYALKNGVVK